MHLKSLGGLCAVAAWATAVATTSGAAGAVELQESTKKLLANTQLDADILNGLDQELKLPDGWLDAATKEGDVRIVATWDPDQFAALSAPFHERYPAIKLNYNRGGLLDRSTKPLIALKSRRILADVIVSPGTDWVKFRDADALADLSELPNFANLSKNYREASGKWIGQKIAYRCMAYNTNIVPKAELPVNWEDIVTNPFWRNGKVAIPDRPDLWLTMLWLNKGPEWTTNYMTRLFTEVKPQLRKEGASAIVALTVAGELPAAIAAAEYRTKQYVEKGAPVYLHCPQPVLVAVSLIIAMKDSKAPKSMRIFLNWLLSKEGQIAQYAADRATPVHKELTDDPRFTPFIHEVEGKPRALRDEVRLVTENEKLIAVYLPLWQGLSGNKGPLPAE